MTYLIGIASATDQVHDTKPDQGRDKSARSTSFAASKAGNCRTVMSFAPIARAASAIPARRRWSRTLS